MSLKPKNKNWYYTIGAFIIFIIVLIFQTKVDDIDTTEAVSTHITMVISSGIGIFIMSDIIILIYFLLFKRKDGWKKTFNKTAPFTNLFVIIIYRGLLIYTSNATNGHTKEIVPTPSNNEDLMHKDTISY